MQFKEVEIVRVSLSLIVLYWILFYYNGYIFYLYWSSIRFLYKYVSASTGEGFSKQKRLVIIKLQQYLYIRKLPSR